MHQDCIASIFGGCNKSIIKRGLILNAGQSQSVSWTPTVGGNRKVWTLAVSLKNISPSTYNPIFDAGNSGNDIIAFNLASAGELQWIANFSGTATMQLRTTRVFRDPTSWHGFVFSLNTPHATAAERARMFDGASQITNLVTATYPALNADFLWNSNVLHQLGKERTNYANLIIGDVHFVEGAALDGDDFYSPDQRSGSMARKKVFGFSYGARGLHLPMVGDAGDAPATATEGVKDRAPIDGTHTAANNATATNLTAASFIKDSPTNYRRGTDYRGNFAVLSAVHRTGSTSFGICLISNGGLTAAPTSALSALASIALPRSGKFYWEVEFSAGANPAFGIGNTSFIGGGNATGTFGWYGNGGNGTVHFLGSTAAADANSPNTVGDIALHYVDIAANKYWIGRRRAGVTTWMGGGDPVAGTSPTFSGSGGGGVYSTALDLSTGTWWPQVSGGNSWTANVNFGQKAFAGTPPSGALPLCVAAIPKASVVRPSTAFVQAVDTAANISAALTALRATWGAAYIDIIKRYDGAEGWRWRFGDDPTNYLDSSTALLGKQAFPALAGNYWGCSIRVGAAYGVATGEIAHINGAATTITDNLGTSRKVVILRRSDAGGDWPVFHPSLASGKLLWLNKVDGETTATDITNVTSNSCQIGSAMASGTYRYIVLSEKSGLISLGAEKGLGSTDGAVNSGGVTPAWHIKKKINSSSNSSWVNWNSARNPHNPRTAVFYLDLNNIEDTTNRELDFLAIGTKAKNVNSVYGGAGDDYVTITFGAFAFATGDCAAQATAR